MSSFKNLMLKIRNWKNVPWIVFAIVMVIVHFLLPMGIGDDEWFLKVLENTDLHSYLVLRYYTWSSRLIIESVLVTLVHFPILWRLLDTVIMILIAVSIAKLFANQDSKKNNWLIFGLMLTYPFNYLGTAGWIATTLNYSWPLAFGLCSMVPIRNIIKGERIRWYEYIVYTLSLLYAANQEQMCTILLVVYSVFTVIMFINQKLPLFMVIQTILCGASFLFILTCPGNAARKAAEVATWFPEYDSIPFPVKIEMGFSSSLFEFVMKPNFIFNIFCGLLLIGIVLKYKNLLYRVIATVPLASGLILGTYSSVTNEFIPGISKIENSLTKFGTDLNLASFSSWIPDLILAVVCIAICISLLCFFKNELKSLLSIFIILLGFGSRVMLGISPTIWASSSRTFIFMYFSFIINSLILWNEIQQSKVIQK